MTAADQLAEDLRSIASTWPLLLDPARDSRGGSGRPDRPPLSTSALSLRAEAPKVLAGWVIYVAKFHDHQHGIPTELGERGWQDAGRMADWLLPWVDTLAADDDARDIFRTIGKLEHRMDVAARGAKVHVFPLGTCPRRIEEPGQRVSLCGQPLTAVICVDEPDKSRVQCEEVREHRWGPRQWDELGHLITPGGRHLLTVKEAAALVDLPPSTVRRWAKQEGRIGMHDVVDGRHYKIDFFELVACAERMNRIESQEAS